MTDTVATIKKKLLQIKALHDAGSMSAAQYKESRARLERSLVDQVMREGGAAAGTAGSAEAASGVPDVAGQKPSGALFAALVAGVLVLAVAGYAWKGSPGAIGGGGQLAGAPAGAAQGEAHATGPDQIAAMADALAARLQSQPDNVEGWVMLARSYTVLGRHADALKAYERAVALRADDADLLVDYADSMAVNKNMTLAGEPMKWVDKALKLDPRNLKGLSLAGTDAFVRKDFAGAIKYWDQVVAIGPADNVFVQQVQGGLAEARELGGFPAAKPASVASLMTAPAAQAAQAAPAAIAGKTVSGTVSLAPGLAKLASPDDTVFVFARAAEGRGMPLAILRKKVRDLPIQFTLDDSSSMSPAATLSAAGTVVVGARISKSGNAMPQNGDMSGQSAPVAVGASALKIEIRDVVKP